MKAFYKVLSEIKLRYMNLNLIMYRGLSQMFHLLSPFTIGIAVLVGTLVPPRIAAEAFWYLFNTIVNRHPQGDLHETAKS